MKITISMVCVCTLTIVGVAVAKDKNKDSEHGVHHTVSQNTHMATSAIPCTPAVGLRFSCSNKSTHETLYVADAKCIIGAGKKPKVQILSVFNDGVAPETSEVAVISCPDIAVPTFCTAQVSSQKNARCVVTSPAGGLNSELR